MNILTSLLVNILCGVVIGVANIIPGVSGGTMAVILNVYDKLIDALSSFRKNIRKNLFFLAGIAIGAGVGILLFSKLISYLSTYHGMMTNFFFIGLILGSIPLILRHATAERFKPLHLIPFAITLLVMIAVVILDQGDSGPAVEMAFSLQTVITLFLASAVAAMAMIIPGISGSFVMVLLGTYFTVLQAIDTFNIPLLLPIGLGCLAGILFGAKLIHALLARFPQATYFGILGFVLGSVGLVFKKAGFAFNLTGLFSIVTMLCGAAIALIFGSKKFSDFFAKRKQPDPSNDAD